MAPLTYDVSSESSHTMAAATRAHRNEPRRRLENACDPLVPKIALALAAPVDSGVQAWQLCAMVRTVRPKALVSILGTAALGVTLAMTACGGDDGDDGGTGGGGGATSGGGTSGTGGTPSVGGTTSAGGTLGQQLQNLRKITPEREIARSDAPRVRSPTRGRSTFGARSVLRGRGRARHPGAHRRSRRIRARD